MKCSDRNCCASTLFASSKEEAVRADHSLQLSRLNTARVPRSSATAAAANRPFIGKGGGGRPRLAAWAPAYSLLSRQPTQLSGVSATTRSGRASQVRSRICRRHYGAYGIDKLNLAVRAAKSRAMVTARLLGPAP